MSAKTRSWWWCTLTMVVMAASIVNADVVLDAAPEETGARSVLLWAHGNEQEWELVDARTGRGSEPPSLSVREASSGARLAWDLVSDTEDELGMRHMVYEQRLHPAPGSETLPAAAERDGVPLNGAVLGFHFAPDGRLKAVGGALFEDVVDVGSLALLSPEAARDMAEWAMANHGEMDVMPHIAVAPALAASLEERTRLALYSNGRGGSFDYVWTVPMLTVEGGAVDVAIHGRTGDLLAAWDPNPTFDSEDGTKLLTLPSCEPGTSTTNHTAVGIPQNVGNVSNRSLHATPATDLQAYYGNGVTHQGRLKVSTLPEIVSYFGTYPGQDQCPETGTQFYRRLPVKTVGSQRQFNDWFDLDHEVPGRSAADAYHKAKSALVTFKNLGWNGFSRVNLVSNNYYCSDNAYFNPNATEQAPASSVVFCKISSDLSELDGDYDFVADDDGHFLHSAALDVVGHELGHGMIFLTAGWAYDTPVHKQLHEGWADVLGLIAEWGVETAGTTFERADWLFGEDIFLNLTPTRRVDASADDGVGGFSLHAQDPAGDPLNNPYQTGIRIPLAFRLAVTGGYNPVCGRLPWLSGCDDINGVNPLPQSDVTQAFFRALRIYGVHMYTFDDLAHYTALAAHDLWWQDFSTNPPACTDAVLQQFSMREAFEAVGHPATGGFICTCQPDCDIEEW